MEYWDNKELVSWEDFIKMRPVDKVRSFAVERVTMDELVKIHQAIARALDTGSTVRDFRNECGTIFTRIGWMQYEEKWRIDDLFHTQVLTAYSVRRYIKSIRLIKYFPYWRYSSVQDIRTRPAHLFMNGKIWPAEHPIWDVWYPLNGPSCRCSTSSLTKGQVERQGVKIETEDPTGTIIHPVDRITGEPLPPVKLTPDEGYGYNPGKLYLGR